MSVIAHLRIPADSFELGRILDLEAGTSLDLENMIPLGEAAVPFFTVRDTVRSEFEQRVRNHPSVKALTEVSRHDKETLYALDWKITRDVFFQGIIETEAQLLSGKGTIETWEFELRFPSHDALSAFQEYCENAHIDLDVGRLYNPTRPGTGPWFGLTPIQRETLIRAVEGGFYSIPRQMSTKELAEEFDVSDQAITERLRRAIIALVENTLIAARDVEREYEPAE